MTHAGREDALETLCARLEERIAPYSGRIEYGNLRMKVSTWDGAAGDCISNVALVYETPGGSTDQINIEFRHAPGAFCVLDEALEEKSTGSVEEVLEHIQQRIAGIPIKRREALQAEMRRQIDSGNNTTGIVVHLNRMVQSSLLGGKITHLELKDAMTYAMQYMNTKASPPA